MNDIDVQQEWQRLEAAYAEMTEDELSSLAEQAYELTDIAKQALRAAMSSRGMKIGLREIPPTHAETKGEEPGGDLDPEELDLTDASEVWDADEARRVMRVLYQAGVPAYLGPENLQDVDAFHSSFESGVQIRVPSVDQQRAFRALARAAAETDHDAEEEKPYVARCPYCHSEEIVFEELVAAASASDSATAQKYRWRCDNCGKEWEDDGLEDETGKQ